MINRPKNWDDVREFGDRPKLPVGAYVCKVKQAVVQSTDYGDQLCVLFDIVDGEYAGFYQDDFDANQRQDRKWKGVLRQFIPKDDGSEKDEWTKSAFKGMVTAFENSNRGFVWNWNEKELAGKEVGIIFRNEEWEYNGKTGWTVRPFRATSVDNVADSSYTLPKDKPLKHKSEDTYNQPTYTEQVSTNSFTELDDDGSDFPF